MRTRIVLAGLLCLSLSGCFWRKQKAPPQSATPPPPKPAPTIQPAPPPPKIETSEPKPSPGVLNKLPDVPKPPAAKPVPRRKPKPKQPAPANTTTTTTQDKLPAPDPGAVTTQPAAPPRLGELLTDTQKADLGRQCDDTLRRVNAGLASLSGKQLSRESEDTVDRVRTFVRQAEQARARDPQAALQLAQRAEVLLSDVLKLMR